VNYTQLVILMFLSFSFIALYIFHGSALANCTTRSLRFIRVAKDYINK